MAQNISLQECFQIIKNTAKKVVNILVVLLEFTLGNLMEFQKKIVKL